MFFSVLITFHSIVHRYEGVITLWSFKVPKEKLLYKMYVMGSLLLEIFYVKVTGLETILFSL